MYMPLPGDVVTLIDNGKVDSKFLVKIYTIREVRGDVCYFNEHDHGAMIEVVKPLKRCLYCEL